MRHFFFILLFLFALNATAHAQALALPHKSKAISYRADQCRYLATEQKASCKGNVVVTRSDLRLTCDHFDAKFDNKGRIVHVLCRGHVHIITKDRVAKSEQAIYSANDQNLLLQGSARVAQKQSRLAGDSIRLNLKTGDIEVLGKVRGLLGKDLMKNNKP